MTTAGGLAPEDPSGTGGRICVLGPLRIEHRQQSVRLRPGASSLVTWLVANRHLPAPAATIAAQLWPHLPADRANQELRRATAQARAAVHGTGMSIVRRGGHVALELPPDALLDADEFERRAHIGLHADAHDHADAAVGHLATALRLWRADEPYVEATHAPAVAGHAVRLVDLRRFVTDTRDALRIVHVGDIRLIAELERKTAERPDDELCWRQLMVALARRGRRADALRAFQRCRQHLATHRSQPAPETTAVEHAILRDAAPDLSSIRPAAYPAR